MDRQFQLAIPPVLQRAAQIAVNAVLPARCLGCGVVVSGPGMLCPACWGRIDFLAPPFCACCGTPFEFAMAQQPGSGETLCGACIRDRPDYERARAVFRYDEESRRLVLAFKHGDQLHGAAAFGRWMARAGAELAAAADFLVPVPLHWTRLFRRRYNQAAILALAVARETAKPALPDLLQRTKRTPSQGRMSPSERRRNIRGAFRVKPASAARIEGRRVLLIDDVMTTGATANACARALLRGGAEAVDVLTLARAVRPLP
jgi:ComF family protein